MKNSFLNDDELHNLTFKKIGKNVLISRFVQFYDEENIEIGNNVRIDDFCILSGKIKLGDYIHISAYNALYGRCGIEMDDYSGLSPRCTVFSATDDFTGDFLIGPMVKKEFTNVISGSVSIGKYCQIGSGSIILPGIKINEGAVSGAMSLINKNLEEWTINKGIPVRFYKKRSNRLLHYLQNFTEGFKNTK